MRMIDILEKKRDKGNLSREEIQFFIENLVSKKIPDYQVSALLMAIFIQGLDPEETTFLTHAMAYSGETLDLSQTPGIKVDKHSTGGVGDKTTLIVAPIVASAGIPVAKMSGRGSGHTGGTLDKLEAIPGFQVGLTRDQFLQGVSRIGVVIAGQTGDIAPADKILYALRDVTATVNHISLIASSVMSKKIASGADKIVLDVKVGSGAFMKTIDQAKLLATEMVDIGNRVGRKVCAMITNMDMPLGFAIGNSLEVIESIEMLKGRGAADLRELSILLASKMVQMGKEISFEAAKGQVHEAIASGRALQKLKQMIENQGGDGSVVEDYSKFGCARISRSLRAPEDAVIHGIGTEILGKSACMLGAGRETKETCIDYKSGIYLHKKVGDHVAKDEVIATFYSETEKQTEIGLELASQAFIFARGNPAMPSLVYDIIEN